MSNSWKVTAEFNSLNSDTGKISYTSGQIFHALASEHHADSDDVTTDANGASQAEATFDTYWAKEQALALAKDLKTLCYIKNIKVINQLSGLPGIKAQECKMD